MSEEDEDEIIENDSIMKKAKKNKNESDKNILVIKVNLNDKKIIIQLLIKKSRFKRKKNNDII